MKKLTLPTEIKTIAQAKSLLDMLYHEDLSYHCEDDATDCLKGQISKKQAQQLNKLMDDIYNLNKNTRIPETFDPCEYVLNQTYTNFQKFKHFLLENMLPKTMNSKIECAENMDELKTIFRNYNIYYSQVLNKWMES